MKIKTKFTTLPRGVSLRRRLSAPVVKFRTEVGKLSYHQLVRISALVSARNEAETKEAKRIIYSLTPTERRIVTSVNTGKISLIRQERRRYIQTVLRVKNADETKGLDSPELIKSLTRIE